ncbi:unnamed protein product, partial [Ixodes pacificus]
RSYRSAAAIQLHGARTRPRYFDRRIARVLNWLNVVLRSHRAQDTDATEDALPAGPRNVSGDHFGISRWTTRRSSRTTSTNNVGFVGVDVFEAADARVVACVIAPTTRARVHCFRGTVSRRGEFCNIDGCIRDFGESQATVFEKCAKLAADFTELLSCLQVFFDEILL